MERMKACQYILHFERAISSIVLHRVVSVGARHSDDQNAKCSTRSIHSPHRSYKLIALPESSGMRISSNSTLASASASASAVDSVSVSPFASWIPPHRPGPGHRPSPPHEPRPAAAAATPGRSRTRRSTACRCAAPAARRPARSGLRARVPDPDAAPPPRTARCRPGPAATPSAWSSGGSRSGLRPGGTLVFAWLGLVLLCSA